MRHAPLLLLSLLMTDVAGSELPADGNLRLVLFGALGADRPSRDIHLDMPRRGGSWEPACYGRNHHRLVEGTVRVEEDEGDGLRMQLELEVLPNPFITGGKARFAVELAPDDKGLAGTFTGNCRMDWPREQRDLDTAGRAEARWSPPWPEPVPDHQQLEPGEHPRLAFRRAGLPEIRRRAEETEAGRAIWQRILETLKRPACDLQVAKHDKFSTWPAAGHALAWRVGGDAHHAEEAKRIVAETLLENPAGPGGRGVSQDIHHAPRVLGLAQAYDLCGEAWDPAFRDRCALEIARRVRSLTRDKMRGMSLAPEANHNAIRVSCAGLGALAVLGDEVDGEPVLPEAAAIARRCAQEVRDLLEGGFGASGNFSEGYHYKIMSSERGLVHFLHAYPLVMGARIDGGPLGDHFLVGDLFKADPGRALPSPRPYDGGAGDEHRPRSVLFAIGITTVPPRYMPAAKWILDRSVGLAGDGSFGITHGLHAVYPLATYPFGCEARPPGEVFPWMLPDPRKGHYLFRPAYRDGEDHLAVLNLKLAQSAGWNRGGWIAGLEILGAGRRWLAGSTLPAVGEGLRNDRHGGRLLAEERPAERVCRLELDLGPAYLRRVSGKDASPEEKRAGLSEAELAEKWRERDGAEAVVRMPARGGRPHLDFGIAARRSLVVDGSGAAGTPLLVAVADRITREGEAVATTLDLPIVHHEGTLTADGGRFRLGPGGGPALHGLVLGGADLELTPKTKEKREGKLVGGAIKVVVEKRHGLRIAGSGPRLTVLFVAAGEPPAVTVDGEGAGAAVTIGERRLRFDGETIVVE